MKIYPKFFRGLSKRIRSSHLLAVCFGIAMLFTAVMANAQRYLGTIQGEVADATGAKIPGATVTAEEGTTHYKTTGTSNGAGAYNFGALQPGTYSVSITAPGFRTETHTNIVLTAGELQQVDFQLATGGGSETIDVSANNVLIDAGSPNISTTLSTQEVTDLPNVGRNPYVLATLAVGVSTGAYMQSKASQFTQPFSGVAVQITADGNGGHNRLTLDGIPNDPAERFSGASYTGFVPSPEAVEEVKIQTSIFDAQIGHGNGTVTNTVIRSGTNRIHGSAYYAFQNTYLNANTYERVPFQNATDPSVRKARNNDQLSQTGFVLNGPVYLPKIYDGRDKTFFLVAFERYASHTAIGYSARVPSAAERAGDFSALCSTFNSSGLCTSGIQLYDPTSPVDSSGNRTAYFANNNIASRITAQGAALMSFLPLPNVPGAPITSASNYISSQTSYPSTYPSFIVRMDHAFGSKNKLNAIFFRSGLTQNYPLEGFPKGIGPVGFGYSVYRNNRGGSLDDVHQFSSSLVLDSRLGIVYHPFGLVYPGSQNYDLSQLSIPSTGLPYVSFPGASFTDNYAGLAPGAGGQISEDTTGSLEEIVTKSIGHHTLRIGFEGNLIRYNVQNPQSGLINTSSSNPGFTFNRLFTQKNYQTGDSTSGDAMAAMLLGVPTTISYNITPAYALQQIYMAPFIQDDWRITSKLTLNLGFRWDYESPFTERYNKQAANFCTTCSNPLQSSVPSIPLNGGLVFTSSNNRYPYPKDWNNFQPRLGLAYQATPTTVLRAGYGIIYFNTLETPVGTGFSQLTGGSTNANANLPLATLANPYPTGVVLPTGSSLGLSTAVGSNISFIDPNHVQPKSTQFTANIQQQFPGNLALQIAYVGVRPTHLEVNHDINTLPLSVVSTSTDPNTNAANQVYWNTNVTNPLYGHLPAGSISSLTQPTIQRQLLTKPFPEFGSVTEQYSSIGSAPYDALQIQVSKPMKNHFSLQGSLTWNKLMLKNNFLNNYGSNPTLSKYQDPGTTLFGNIFAIIELPRFQKRPAYQRLLIGGWKLNTILRAQNGSLISAPGSVDQIGDPTIAPRTYQRMFNTCYQTVTANTSGSVTTATVTTVNTNSSTNGCDAVSPATNIAYRQRFSYTMQYNDPYIHVRQIIHPLVDASLFKQFIIHEGTSFEIRGEFFNILNTPNFGGPGTGLNSTSYGFVTLNQANDARIGQLTARINF